VIYTGRDQRVQMRKEILFIGWDRCPEQDMILKSCSAFVVTNPPVTTTFKNL